MFTVEDVNSCVDELRCNGYHRIDTSLCSSGYFLADFVKVKRTVSGFDFTVVNGLWTGGFYCTDSDGEYLDLSSGYSYSSGVLSVTTDETDLVLVLYLCSFFDESDFDVQYLDCTLDDLDTDIGSISVGVDDVTSLNGTAVVSGDITVTDNTVDIRGNTFYKDMVELPSIPIVELGEYNCYVGTKSNSVELISNTAISGVTVHYLNKVEYVEFTGTSGTVDLDLSEHLTLDNVPLRVVVDETDDYASLTYDMEVEVEYYQADSKNSFLTAINNGIRYIEITSPITVDSIVTIENDVTIIANYTSQQIPSFNGFIIKDNVTAKIQNMRFSGTYSTNGTLFKLNENVNLEIENCVLYSGGGNNSSSIPSIICANEDVANTNSKVVLKDCTLQFAPMPMIMFDGTLEIADCSFNSRMNDLYSFNSNSLKEEPCFIHMVEGSLTITNTEFGIRTPSDFVMEGYQLCSVLLGENVTFNGVKATDIDKDTGGKIRSQNHITATTTGNYKNGTDTISIDGTFYGAVENHKIIEWK